MPQTDLWLSEIYDEGTRLQLRIEKTLFRERSEYQDVLVAESTSWGRVMFLDGLLMLTEKDEFVYHEMLAHVPLSSHPEPSRVLVVGGGDGGTVREVLKHDPEHVDLVEIDRMVVDSAREYLPFVASALDDDRVEVHFEDGARWVQEHAGQYDVVLVDSTDPIGPGKVLFSEPFYRACRAALRPGGVFANQAEGPVLNAEVMRGVYRELRKAWPHVAGYLANCPTYPMGTWTLGYASADVPVAEAVKRGVGAPRPLETRYYNPELHRAAFVLPTYIQRITQG